ncbi:MAG: ribonuclease P protein component [Desulfobulbaceae bacterium]|nr:ribonuclease P protein component [Desulfobulbaceae bacterium]
MQGLGLPKACLLRESREFMQVYQQGRRLKGPGFSLIFVTNDTGCSRLGISIHRMLRGAVRRNRIKRIVREVFRLHRELFPQASDIVVTVGPQFSLSTYDSFLQAMSRLPQPDQVKKS